MQMASPPTLWSNSGLLEQNVSILFILVIGNVSKKEEEGLLAVRHHAKLIAQLQNIWASTSYLHQPWDM